MKTTLFVVAITGPAGAGKSTVASKLAEKIDRCVNIDADHVKHFIVNGFVYDETPEGVIQWKLLGQNISILARSFLDAGYNVIINGYINEPAWKQIARHITLTHKILLLPELDTVKMRDVGRSKDIAMGAEAVTTHHDYFSTADFYDDFIRLDTTKHDIDQTGSIIKDKL